MSTLVNSSSEIPWWKEPTKDQWIAWIAAWLGWTLDAFDFTIFLLIMVPIAESFNVPLIEVTAVFTVTLWLRLVGAVGSGWLADRIGRKTPLMISILWYSICNFAAGLSPTFALLFLFRALLGIGMGAEWPAGAALAMESWPTRSRGLMSGVLQGSWSIGFLLSSLAYGMLYDKIGWRGLLMLGILPALANLVGFLASGFWGHVADVWGRRWAMIIPAIIGAFVTPLYLFTDSYAMVAGAFIVQGAFLGAIYGQNPCYLSERFPTEVRATASGFCYHQGAIWAGFTGQC